MRAHALRRLELAGAVVFATLTLGACGGRTHPNATSEPDSEWSTQMQPAQPGDHLTLQVWGEPKLSGDLIVDPQGEIVLPKTGALRVSAIPATSLRDTIQSLLAQYVRDAKVDVVVLKRIAVNGAVGKPGVYFVEPNMSLSDVVAKAGGVSEMGKQSKLDIVRGNQTFEVPDWQRSTSKAPVLESGDQIIVSRRNWFSINALSVASLSLVVASFILSLRK